MTSDATTGEATSRNTMPRDTRTDSARLQRLGNSTGIALRKEILARAGFRRGDPVRLLAAPGEIRILPAEGPFVRCLDLGRGIAARYRRVFTALQARPPAAPSWPGAETPRTQDGAAEPSGSPGAVTQGLGIELPPAEALLALEAEHLQREETGEGQPDRRRTAVRRALSATAALLDRDAAAAETAVGSSRRTRKTAGGQKQSGTGRPAAEKTAAGEPAPPLLASLAARLARQLAEPAASGGQGRPALAFLAANLLLELNGQYLDVTEGAAVEAMTGLLAGKDGEAAFARWVAAGCCPLHRWYA